MIFDFSVQKTFNRSIDVVNIGNTALRCTNKQMDNYYLITKTIYGKTSILKFGPVCPDIETLINDFSVSYKKVDYKENVLFKEIDKFCVENSMEFIPCIQTLAHLENMFKWMSEYEDIKDCDNILLCGEEKT
jgi:hypothetical protein